MTADAVRLYSLSDVDETWKHLMSQDQSLSFFSSPAWLQTWWKHHGEDREPLLIQIGNEHGPVALALLCLESIPRVSGGRRIRFLGAGLSDYGDLIVDEHFISRSEAVRVLLDYLVVNFPNAVFDFEEIPEGSRTLPALRKSLESHRLSFCIADQDVCPVARLPVEQSAYHKQLGKSFLLDVRRGERRLRERGNVMLVPQVRPENGDWMSLFRQMASLQSQRMRTKGEVPMWEGPLGEFVKDVLQAADQAGSLSLMGLYLDGQMIAYELCFVHNQSIYVWSRAFDESFRTTGPGKITLLRVIEDGIEQGGRTLDLLRGEEPYKAQWANDQVTNFRVTFMVKPSLSVYLWFKYTTSWKPWLRNMRWLTRVYRALKVRRGGAK